ncbi:MAG: dihydrolipoamide acetyltransferase family protein [Chloroflexota bacterium]|nr:dihydrolipoamide acetyltransferase family protein [Chloroflexota bacterium]
MAVPVIIQKLGNSVESCLLIEWKKAIGDAINEGEPLADVETDKAVMEVVSPASGTLLALFASEGDEVPVLSNVAAVGEPGEDVEHLRPAGGEAEGTIDLSAPSSEMAAAGEPGTLAHETTPAPEAGVAAGISPRAKNLARDKEVDPANLLGSGPGGRVIERDVVAALALQPRLSPVAQAMVDTGEFQAPDRGSGPGGRVMSNDLMPAETPQVQATMPTPQATAADDIEIIQLKGMRKLIAERMLSSLQTTAQLTLNASADARTILDYRKRFKASDERLGLQKITINDLILFAVSRTLPEFPSLNALFLENEVHRYRPVHLAVAVDTPRGLVVPVIRHADSLSLQQLSQEAKRLAQATLDGRISPDELTGGTFTVTNLGSLGVENFTPVLNPPQVGILGVGNINLKPVQVDDKVEFVPHIGLSLTINHQVVDGAPAARFLQALSAGLADIGLLLAL